MNEFFEIRNETSDEVYHSLGFAKTLDEAKAMIHSCDESPSDLDNVYDGHLEIGIYRREFGWSNGGCNKCLWKIVYDEIETDDADDYKLQITFEGVPEK